MDVNPYEAPREAEPKGAFAQALTKYQVSKFELGVFCCLILFFLAAAGHRCQLPSPLDSSVTTYTRSPLIAVEVFGVLGCLLVIPVLLCRSMYLLFQKRIVAGVMAIVLCPVSFGTLILAMYIDAPTLIYAT